MELLARLMHQFCRVIRRNGVNVLTTNGDPLLVEAFQALGWEDPHEDAPVSESASALASEPANERATLEPPEHAVLPRPDGHTG